MSGTLRTGIAALALAAAFLPARDSWAGVPARHLESSASKVGYVDLLEQVLYIRPGTCRGRRLCWKKASFNDALYLNTLLYLGKEQTAGIRLTSGPANKRKSDILVHGPPAGPAGSYWVRSVREVIAGVGLRARPRWVGDRLPGGDGIAPATQTVYGVRIRQGEALVISPPGAATFIQARGVRATVLGSHQLVQFDVNAGTGSAAFTAIQGRVSLTPIAGGQPVILTTGQQVIVAVPPSRRHPLPPRREVNTSSVRQWSRSARIVPNPLRAAEVGRRYVQQLRMLASDGTTQFRLTGKAPPGLQLNRNGVLSGTPTVPGKYRLNVRGVGRGGQQVTNHLSLSVAAPVRIATTRLPPVCIRCGSQPRGLTARDGVPPYRWSKVGGDAPVSVSPDGRVTPLDNAPPGKYQLTVMVTDAAGGTDQQTITYVLYRPLSIDPAAGQIADVMAGALVPLTVTATGGTPPYSWNAVVTGTACGPIPTCSEWKVGPISSVSAVVSGSFPQPGAADIHVTVTDRLGLTASADYTVNVQPGFGPAARGRDIAPSWERVPGGWIGRAHRRTE